MQLVPILSPFVDELALQVFGADGALFSRRCTLIRITIRVVTGACPTSSDVAARDCRHGDLWPLRCT
eukprot:4555047-Lingulodinium_polyedra.AAC.1